MFKGRETASLLPAATDAGAAMGSNSTGIVARRLGTVAGDG